MLRTQIIILEIFTSYSQKIGNLYVKWRTDQQNIPILTTTMVNFGFNCSQNYDMGFKLEAYPMRKFIYRPGGVSSFPLSGGSLLRRDPHIVVRICVPTPQIMSGLPHSDHKNSEGTKIYIKIYHRYSTFIIINHWFNSSAFLILINF